MAKFDAKKCISSFGIAFSSASVARANLTEEIPEPKPHLRDPVLDSQNKSAIEARIAILFAAAGPGNAEATTPTRAKCAAK